VNTQPVATAAPAASGSSASVQKALPADRVANLYSKLLYVAADNSLATIGRTDKAPQSLIAKPWLSDAAGTPQNLNLSPDGRRLIYTISNADGSNPRAYLLDTRAATLDHTKYNGNWDRASQRVVTAVGGQIHVYNVETGKDETLGGGDWPTWSADNRIVYLYKGTIWAFPYPDRSKAAQISFLPDSGAGAWTIVGPLVYHYTNRVLFLGGPANDLGAQGNGLQLHAVDMSNHQVTNLAGRGGNGVLGMALSPSGQQIAWTEQAHSSACVSLGSVRVARADRVGTEWAVKLPASDKDFFVLNGVTWSPDQWLAFGGQELSCDSAGAGQKALGAKGIYLVNPANPNAPQRWVDGSNPLWVMPRGLGDLPTGLGLH
jgi:hypothetical protein